MTAQHNQALLTDLGIVLINRPRARRNPKVKGRPVGKRVPDEGPVETKVIKRADGAREHLVIYQRDGNLGVMELKENGEPYFVPLEATKLFMNENQKKGSTRYRPYVGLRLPPEIALRTGRREVTVALYQTARDKKRGYARTAHVRAIGPASEDFRYYRQFRGDSESFNRTVEDSLYRNHRAHSDGWARQQVDMLGLAGLINALTRERMRRQAVSEAA